ncbi:hypothetical protein EON73_05845 [bacterium]|nr:MAG: hypothetical protein EON73_05845 [bacterium]
MTNLLEIKIKKVNYKLDVDIDSEASIANLDIAFKDICIQLRSAYKNKVESVDNGYCSIIIFNVFPQDYNISNLTKEQIINRVEFYLNSVSTNKHFILRSPLHRTVEKCCEELEVILKSISIETPKQQILLKFGDKIDFFNKHLFHNLLPSREVEIIQTGFSSEELKIILHDIYERVKYNRNFSYNVNFSDLTFT